MDTFLASLASNTVTKSASLSTTNPPVFALLVPAPPLSLPPSSLPVPPPLRLPPPMLLRFPPPRLLPLAEDSEVELVLLLIRGLIFSFVYESQ